VKRDCISSEARGSAPLPQHDVAKSAPANRPNNIVFFILFQFEFFLYLFERFALGLGDTELDEQARCEAQYGKDAEGYIGAQGALHPRIELNA
jgi:hypothetical protein